MQYHEINVFELYNGFYINDPFGNNAFSFNQRTQKSIYVPRLIKGTLNEIGLGSEIVFSEIDDGIEKNHIGLKNFLWLEHADKQIFVFDNHNHAFFFWYWGYINEQIPKNRRLLHIDQHKDTRTPKNMPPFDVHSFIDLKQIWYYTNYELNVGNFIPPAKDCGLIDEVITIDGQNEFEKPIPDFDILDIDLDIFASEMDYIDYDIKMNYILKAINHAHFITIATSPYFLDQKVALRILYKLFN
jgi:hypothetical protein